MAIPLSKKVIAGTVVNYYNNPEFPDGIYISLENSYSCGMSTVVNTVSDMESTLEFTPLANIADLVLNIPSKEEYFNYFKEKYSIMDVNQITRQMEQDYWSQYPFHFASSVGGRKIIWE